MLPPYWGLHRAKHGIRDKLWFTHLRYSEAEEICGTVIRKEKEGIQLDTLESAELL